MLMLGMNSHSLVKVDGFFHLLMKSIYGIEQKPFMNLLKYNV